MSDDNSSSSSSSSTLSIGECTIKYKRVSVRIAIDENAVEPLTVARLFANIGITNHGIDNSITSDTFGILETLHVSQQQQPQQCFGVVDENKINDLLEEQTILHAGRTYLLVLITRLCVSIQNVRGEQQQSVTLQYLEEKTPTVSTLSQELKTRLGIVQGNFGIKKRNGTVTNYDSELQPVDTVDELLPSHEILKTGNYIFAPSIHYRLRFRNGSSNPIWIDLDFAFAQRSIDLVQALPQTITNFRYPALFPLPFTNNDVENDDSFVRTVETLQDRQIMSDAVPGGEYVVILLHKYLIHGNGFAASGARRVPPKVLFYKERVSEAQILKDLALDAHRHKLQVPPAFAITTATTTTTTTTKLRINSNLLEPGKYVLEDVVPILVIPACTLSDNATTRFAEIHCLATPQLRMFELLQDPNLSPLMDNYYPATLDDRYNRMIIFALEYNNKTNEVKSCLSPFTTIQELSMPTDKNASLILYAGLEFARKICIHHNEKETNFKFPESDCFDTVLRFAIFHLIANDGQDTNMTVSDEMSDDSNEFNAKQVRYGLYTSIAKPNLNKSCVQELSGPTIRRLRIGAVSESCSHSLVLEQLFFAEIYIPGFSEPQYRWLPRSWPVKNILQLLDQLFDFVKRGFNPIWQVPALYKTGESLLLLLEFEPVYQNEDEAKGKPLTLKFQPLMELDFWIFATETTSEPCKAMRSVPCTITCKDILKYVLEDELLLPEASKADKKWTLSVQTDRLLIPKTLDEDWLTKEEQLRWLKERSGKTKQQQTAIIRPGIQITIEIESDQPNLLSMFVPTSLSVQEICNAVQHRQGLSSEKVLAILHDSIVLPYTMRLHELVTLTTSTDLHLVARQSSAVHVHTTFQGQTLFLLPVPSELKIKAVKEIAAKQYHLLADQELEICGGGYFEEDEPLSRYAIQQRLGLNLEICIRIGVEFCNNIGQHLFDLRPSISITLQVLRQMYISFRKLHPSVNVQLFYSLSAPAQPPLALLSLPSLPESKVAESKITVPLVSPLPFVSPLPLVTPLPFVTPITPVTPSLVEVQDYNLPLSSTLPLCPQQQQPQKQLMLRSQVPSTKRFVVLETVQLMTVFVYNIGGLGESKMIKIRQFATAFEVGYAASLAFGHSGSATSWSVQPHCNNNATFLETDSIVKEEQYYDLYEWKFPPQYIAVQLVLPKSFRPENNACLRPSLDLIIHVMQRDQILSEIPGFDSKHEDLSLELPDVTISKSYGATRLTDLKQSLSDVLLLQAKLPQAVCTTTLANTNNNNSSVLTSVVPPKSLQTNGIVHHQATQIVSFGPPPQRPLSNIPLLECQRFNKQQRQLPFATHNSSQPSPGSEIIKHKASNERSLILYVISKPNLICTMQYNETLQTYSFPAQNTFYDLLIRLNLNPFSKSIQIWNTTTNTLVDGIYQEIAVHQPSLTFRVVDTAMPAAVKSLQQTTLPADDPDDENNEFSCTNAQIGLNKQLPISIKYEHKIVRITVPPDWPTKHVISLATTHFHVPPSSSWGLYLLGRVSNAQLCPDNNNDDNNDDNNEDTADTVALHPESIPNYIIQSRFLLKRRSSSASASRQSVRTSSGGNSTSTPQSTRSQINPRAQKQHQT